MTTIKNCSELDDISKAIMRLIDTADHAFIGARALDDKVEMERLRKELYAMQNIYRLQRFRLEDAIDFSKSSRRCDKCGSLTCDICN